MNPFCNVECPECSEVFEIHGNDLEIECPECGFEGDQTDFPDAEAQS
jgi:hypothetical protein